MISATYSPDDNKLRLYSSSKLDKDTYERVKRAGFAWAPKQGLFVAPAWSPDREDLARELADSGEVGDEDTSLVERAEERAERFEDYSEKRADDAERARAGVDRITSGIPMGQPILIGHHSEKHARKDAEKIENGMRRAVKMWETSKYWEDRAAGSLRHAKYKEIPAVRARRIKGLEADLRKVEKNKAQAEALAGAWGKEGLTLERARLLANYAHTYVIGTWSAYDVLKPDGERYAACPAMTPEEVQAAILRNCAYQSGRWERWINHLQNRLTYERAMLAESGGLAGASFAYQVGGQVLRRGQWFVIVKVNKRGGVVSSVSVSGHFSTTVTLDEITDYKPPEEGVAEKVSAAMEKGPMCNYPGEGFNVTTYDEWKKHQYSDWPKAKIIAATETHGKHRIRARKGAGWTTVGVYLTDKPRIDPPKPDNKPRATSEDFKPKKDATYFRGHTPKPEPSVFDAMRGTLEAGIQVVTANQLFPTPVALAARVVELAEIEAHHRVLEPSAGTGRLLQAIGPAPAKVAVEISGALVDVLIRGGAGSGVEIVQGDFLQQNGNLGKFDRIVMNPPFERGDDIKHIQHARTFLKDGGRLVAICANGPRQRAALEPIATAWIDLEPGSFAESGTNVNAAIVVIDA